MRLLYLISGQLRSSHARTAGREFIRSLGLRDIMSGRTEVDRMYFVDIHELFCPRVFSDYRIPYWKGL
jgi:hypothetical protein